MAPTGSTPPSGDAREERDVQPCPNPEPCAEHPRVWPGTAQGRGVEEAPSLREAVGLLRLIAEAALGEKGDEYTSVPTQYVVEAAALAARSAPQASETVLRDLVVAMRKWGAEEDGIPDIAWDAYDKARRLLGETFGVARSAPAATPPQGGDVQSTEEASAYSAGTLMPAPASEAAPSSMTPGGGAPPSDLGRQAVTTHPFTGDPESICTTCGKRSHNPDRASRVDPREEILACLADALLHLTDQESDTLEDMKAAAAAARDQLEMAQIAAEEMSAPASEKRGDEATRGRGTPASQGENDAHA